MQLPFQIRAMRGATNGPATGIETRASRFASVGVAGTPGKESRIVGIAAPFDKWSEDLGGFVEIIRPGAFRRTLRERPDVFAFAGHDDNMVLGRTGSGTLQLREAAAGLAVTIDPPKNYLGRGILESVRRGDLSAMSFSFKTVRDKWSKASDGRRLRELFDVDLYEVSIVAFPAYRDTAAAARTCDEWQASLNLAQLETLKRKIIAATW